LVLVAWLCTWTETKEKEILNTMQSSQQQSHYAYGQYGDPLSGGAAGMGGDNGYNYPAPPPPMAAADPYQQQNHPSYGGAAPPFHPQRPSPFAYPLRGIPHPHAHDVLCGRGGQSNTHAGNLQWRTREYLCFYLWSLVG
jgi:hypothetical protein